MWRTPAMLVHANRYLAGRVAESRFNCTVHLLDDGFQHLQLARSIDLLVAPPADYVNVGVLPFGRFREPLESAAAADALLVPVPDVNDEASHRRMSERLKVPTAFRFTRTVEAPTSLAPVFAFAGIAKPDDFFAELERAGWRLAGRRAFRDHHIYSLRDLEALQLNARGAAAETLVTTAKDAVRIAAVSRAGEAMPIVEVALQISIEPPFEAWLQQRLALARAA
jgi:tetraacyldisaccharide 4'-kinase